MVEKLGRKATTMLASLPSIVGWFFLIYFRFLPFLTVLLMVISVLKVNLVSTSTHNSIDYGIETITAGLLCGCVWGRTLTGLMMGMVLVSVPLYVAEISSTDMRGLLGSAFQLGITIGNLATFLLGSYVNWQWLAVVAIALTGLNCLLMTVSR